MENNTHHDSNNCLLGTYYMPEMVYHSPQEWTLESGCLGLNSGCHLLGLLFLASYLTILFISTTVK